MKSHSWTAKEDLWIIETLKGVRDGFFFDAGASDGLNRSNSL